jgi:hypothetical protein
VTITGQHLEDITIEIARKISGDEVFQRRVLMLAVEKEVRRIGAWTKEDDRPSGSVGEKSEGLAKIDWAISHLYQHGRLDRKGRNRWIVPK